MKRQYFAFFLLLISLISLQCQKELSKDRFGMLDRDIISGIVQGNILDEQGMPASGVHIKVGDEITLTDNDGFFLVKDVLLKGSASFVVAEKEGYFKGIRSFLPTAGDNYVKIQLLKKELTGTIRNSGGKISLPNGASVSLAAASVQKRDGTAYSGDINVYLKYIDPNSSTITQILPGSYMAEDKSGNRVSLVSYGMMAVELESPSGERLQLKEGMPATLTTPIPSKQLQSAPSSIGLWYIDEEKGIWKEEGSATKQGNVYIGTVKHFSFWNCDVRFPAIKLSLTLKNAAGDPLESVLVRVTRLGDLGMTSGYTDSKGNVSGLVPKGERLGLAWEVCGRTIDSTVIGPFNEDTNLGDIHLIKNTPAERTVKGVLLNCNNLPVKNGEFVLYFDQYNRLYGRTNVNGEFTVSWLHCPTSSTTIAGIGMDYDEKEESGSANYTLTGPVTDLGSIIACGNSSQTYFDYKLDNVDFASRDSLIAYSYSGNDPVRPFVTVVQGLGSNNYISLTFKHNQTAGNHPVVTILANEKGSAVAVSPFNVNLVNYPLTISDFWEGNFSGNYKDSSTNLVHSISGSFRVRK